MPKIIHTWLLSKSESQTHGHTPIKVNCLPKLQVFHNFLKHLMTNFLTVHEWVLLKDVLTFFWEESSFLAEPLIKYSVGSWVLHQADFFTRNPSPHDCMSHPSHLQLQKECPHWGGHCLSCCWPGPHRHTCPRASTRWYWGWGTHWRHARYLQKDWEDSQDDFNTN